MSETAAQLQQAPAAPVAPAAVPKAADRIFVGFSTTDVFLSKVIRGISGAAYSHAWLCHGHQLWGGAWVTQADWPTVHSWPYEVATHTWSKVMVYEVIGELYTPMQKAMEQSRGLFEERFDISGLFGMAIVTLAKKWAHQRIKNPLAHPDSLFCSEFVERVLRATNQQAFAKWSPEDSSPNQVYETCGREHGFFRRVEREEFVVWLQTVGLPRAQILEGKITSRAEWAPPHPR